MSDVPADGDASDTRARSRRKQTTDAIGDLLPETTRDESADGWGERGESSRDEELLRDVPPHHQ